MSRSRRDVPRLVRVGKRSRNLTAPASQALRCYWCDERESKGCGCRRKLARHRGAVEMREAVP